VSAVQLAGSGLSGLTDADDRAWRFLVHPSSGSRTMIVRRCGSVSGVIDRALPGAEHRVSGAARSTGNKKAPLPPLCNWPRVESNHRTQIRSLPL
jgi:hypothetical protein